MTRENCWEHMDCGREPGGKRADLLGVCPAAVCVEFHDINHGKAAGRICWVMDDTLCPGAGADKLDRCLQCPFFELVAREEGVSFVPEIGVPGGGT